MEQGKNFIRYELGIMVAVLIAAGIVVWQFFTPLLLATITAYILYPLVSKIHKKVYFYDAAILITLVLILAPLIALVNIIAGDVGTVVSSLVGMARQLSGFVGTLNTYAASYGLEAYFSNLPTVIDTISVAMQQKLLTALSNLPHILLSILVYAIATYFLLRDGYKIHDFIMEYSDSLNFRDRRAIDTFFVGVKNSFDVLFFAHIGMAVASAVMTGIGFYIFGVPYPAVFGFLVGLFSFLPLLGAWLAYGGAALLQYVTTGSTLSALLVLSWGFIFGNLLPDFIVKPWLGAKIGKVHPLTIIIGFIGGPFVFGFLGFIMGPIILVLAETVIKGFLQLQIDLNKKKHHFTKKHAEHARRKTEGLFG